MSYLGSFGIDDYVGIPAATHRFSSGAAYAPTVLTYSIYEEATAVGLDEDVDMTVASPFDSITGCYWARRQLTAAAGFEAGKNYLVVVKATVDSVAAIQMHTFQVAAKVDARYLGGTAQTGRDVGASVLLSSGSGAGQLDFTSGVVKANLAQILGTALTETAGLIAAGFKKFFNVATPTGTVNSLPDAVAGAASGLAIVGSVMGKSPATLAAGDVSGNLPTDLQTIKTQAVTCAAGVTVLASVGAPAAPGSNGGLPTTNGTKLNQTVDLTAGQSIAASSVPNVTLANGAHGGAGTTITLQTPIVANATQIEGGDATDAINAAVDVALNTAIPGSPTADSINERIAAIDGKLPSKAYLTGTANSDGDVQADEATGNFPGTVAKSPATLAAADVSGNLAADLKAITAGVDLSDTMKASVTAAVPTAAAVAAAVGAGQPASETYAAAGTLPTRDQAILAILQLLSNRAIASTTMTVKKLDGSTTAMTFTLDDATAPTSITRAS